MVQVDLQPLAQTPESLPVYLDLNLRRLADAIAILGRVEQATVTFTGTVTIDSGIPIVQNVVATLAVAPVAGACFLRAVVNPLDESQVILYSYSNGFVQSVIATTVNVIIIGDEPPNTPTRA